MTEQTRMAVAMLSLAVLVIYAAIEKSAVMFVSVVAIGAAVYIFRRARMRDRVIAIVAAGIGGSIGAEIVRTLYHHSWLAKSEAVGESGGLFLSAMLNGVIVATAVVAVVYFAEAWSKRVARKSEREEEAQ